MVQRSSQRNARGKIDFVASATLPENLLPAMLLEGVRTVVAEIADPLLQQDMIDRAINQSFRRDLLARGRRRRFPGGPRAADLRVEGLARPLGEIVAIKTGFGEFTIREQVFTPVFDALQDGTKQISELLMGQNQANVLQALILLAHGGHVANMREQMRDWSAAQRFNQACAMAALAGAPYTYVAAPGIGSALPVRDVDLMLLGLDHQGVARDALSAKLLEALGKLGRKLLLDGKPVDGDEAGKLAKDLVKDVFVNRVPGWRRLGIVP